MEAVIYGEECYNQAYIKKRCVDEHTYAFNRDELSAWIAVVE